MLMLSSGFVLLAATTTGPSSGSGATIVVVIALGLVLLWVLSLRLHPYTACSACKGKSRLFGAFATRSFRLCSTCGGKGRRKRVMADVWARNRDLS